MLYRLQSGTKCRRCNCLILPTDTYRALNYDGCIVFVHTERL